MRVSEPIEVFRTADGKHFPTKEKAEEHALDQIREQVDKILMPLIETGKRSQSENYQTVITLLPDVESLEKLDNIFRKYDLDR